MSAERKKAFIVALTKLAIRRQAEVDTAALTIYAEDLVDDVMEDRWLLKACDDLGLKPRQEFETAFPAVGNIIERAWELLREHRWRQTRLADIQREEAKQLPEPVSKTDAVQWLDQIKKAAHGVKVDGE